jgi:hypothetical protein
VTGDHYLASPYRYEEGWVDYVTVTQPAAGAAASVIVPGEYGVRVLAARATFAADANAANRLVSLDFIDANGVTRVRNCPSVVWTANTSAQAFMWSHQWTISEWNTNTPVLVPVLPLLLPPGWQVKFAVDSIQAGDQLSALSLVVEKVPTGARGKN